MMPRPTDPKHRLWRPLPPPRLSRLWLAIWSVIVLVVLGSVVYVQVVPHGCSFDRRGKAEIDLKAIEGAINLFRARDSRNRLPEPSAFPAGLCEPGPNGEPPPLDPDRLESGRLLDPWGNAYVYVKHDAHSFHLSSFGADGEQGGRGEDADITIEKP
jgi:general secretion pathway protein G